MPLIKAHEVRTLQALDDAHVRHSLQKILFAVENTIRIQALSDPDHVRHVIVQIPMHYEYEVVREFEFADYVVSRYEAGDTMAAKVIALRIDWSGN